MNEKLMFPLKNLQMFNDQPPAPNPEPNVDDQPKTFTQEQLDQAIKDAIAAERTAWQQEVDNQMTEAQKLEGMTEKEKKEYQEQKRISDLEEREKKLARRELAASAIDMLNEKKLPAGLNEILNYEDAEKCKASIDVVERVFNKAVQDTVDELIKGGKPMKKAPEEHQLSKKEQLLKDSQDLNLSLAQRVAARNELYKLEEEK